MAGAGAAHAGAHAAVRLRTLCASAAASIREECDYVLQQRSSSATRAHIRRGAKEDSTAPAAPAPAAAGEAGMGSAAGDGNQSTAATANGNKAGLGLADCGEPLVHLLSRQASRLVALYEAAVPSSPSLSSPVAVGPVKAAERDRLPTAVPSPAAHGARQLRGGHDGPGQGGAVLDELVLKRLDDIISIAYSKFYAYLYKDLPLCWRQLYTDASILKFSYLFLSSSQQSWALERDGPDAARSSQDARDAAEQLEVMVKTLDLALILAGAGGTSRGRTWIDTAFDLFESAWDPFSTGGTITTATHSPHHGLLTMTASASSVTPPPAKRAKLDSSAHTAALGQAARSFSTFEPFTPPVRNPIRRVSADAMNMAAFQRYLDCADPHRGPEPLILTGLIEDWPARGSRSWNNPEYLLSRTFGGRRLVPVEIGRSYVDEGWSQKIVTFGQFLRDHIDPTSTAPREPPLAPTGQEDQERRCTPAAEQQASDRSGAPPGRRPAPVPTAAAAAAEAPTAEAPTAEAPTAAAPPVVAYLAQHQLFLQLPRLRNDVLIPDHCYTTPPPHPTDRSQDQPELDTPLLNAWLGPPGTITPLHTDPYHNLLAQVVGRKYARLYSPLEAGAMRARGTEAGVEMHNTSAWDVGVLEGWDADPTATTTHHPAGGDGEREEGEEGGGGGSAQFGGVPFLDCVLQPGDTLYVPIGWWHYVRGLSVSFSVSLWWNGAED
ncbi:hypothetical protein Daus18300_001542 [Diaporthe australafricana]|uniref:JmjC domain-containing protein n=1 Tax=Diaporthe australafricana TaxID=127596 RepID=A0ABR3XVL6_9PEZI